jgi:hypothetical protein
MAVMLAAAVTSIVVVAAAATMTVMVAMATATAAVESIVTVMLVFVMAEGGRLLLNLFFGLKR